MADVEGVALLHWGPSTPDWSVLSKLAESRNTLFMDGANYSLLTVRNIENYPTT